MFGQDFGIISILEARQSLSFTGSLRFELVDVGVELFLSSAVFEGLVLARLVLSESLELFNGSKHIKYFWNPDCKNCFFSWLSVAS